MLQIRDISKKYITGGLEQMALDGVSLDLRDNEFVAILGPSGSGKTTLLNIIGGLDRYDTGDLIINGVSTKNYRDRDWDSYRNHTIGFVFQSYNLIPHQTVLANVELALTISGISRSERRRRAQEALVKVGLGEHIHKRPNQMSGGQMQRVAIARALVNDPDILLADEPTGALDTETSIQVMDLLKEVARDRLVVMVTHNPELAEEYATRIVKLRDGKIIADSDPIPAAEIAGAAEGVHRNFGRASMSFLTSLALSANNLRTKKARTILVSFASSIGIIGIALILSLSNGVNQYIQNIEEQTLSEYPLVIQKSSFDLASLMSMELEETEEEEEEEETEVRVTERPIVKNMFSRVDNNDLASLKQYLDSPASGIRKYARSVEYGYNITPLIYREDGNKVRQVSPDPNMDAFGMNMEGYAMMGFNMDFFHALPEEEDLYRNQYDLLAGSWPDQADECILILSSPDHISDLLLYTLGLKDAAEYDRMIQQFANGENVVIEEHEIGNYQYTDFLGISFHVVNSADCYVYDREYKVWTSKTDDEAFMKKLVRESGELKIVGVAAPQENAKATMLSVGIGYHPALIAYVVEQAEASDIVKAQQQAPEINVFTGKRFDDSESAPDLDLSKLFHVDEDAMEKAFSFDESKLQLDASALTFPEDLDLANTLDLGKLAQNLPQPDAEALANLLSGVNVQFSQENMEVLFRNLLAGYETYAQGDPATDYSKLGDAVEEYIQSEATRRMIEGRLGDLVRQSGIAGIAEDELQSLAEQLLAGYQDYLISLIRQSQAGVPAGEPGEGQEAGDTPPIVMPDLSTSVRDYLATPEAQALLQGATTDLATQLSTVEIDPEELQALAADLSGGYVYYAQENGKPDPEKIQASFQAYLATPAAQQMITEGVKEVLNVDEISEELTNGVTELIGNYSGALGQAIGTALESAITSYAGSLEGAMTQMMEQLATGMQDAFQFDADALQKAFRVDMDDKELEELFNSLLSGGNATYEGNLRKLGYAKADDPYAITIYPRNFEGKNSIIALLNDYNARMEEGGEEEKVITFNDLVGTLMSSVTNIVNSISYVLIAFVAISLVVSSIMIGVITYISVLERTKEIGILRAIGASKRNISQVFNAETFIIGLFAGLIGVGLSLLLLIPGNAIIWALTDNPDIRARLPILAAFALIGLSILLTVLGGLLPAGKASRKDPVTALRSE